MTPARSSVYNPLTKPRRVIRVAVQAAHGGAVQEGEKRMRRKSVLIVDDDAFMRSMIRAMLQGIGLDHVEIAEDGAIGLSKLRALPAQYGLVLLDLDMPVTGGLAFLRELRQEPDARLHELPVVLLTAEPERRNAAAANSLGASGFVAKSDVTATELAPYVERALSTESAARTAHAAPPNPGAARLQVNGARAS